MSGLDPGILKSCRSRLVRGRGGGGGGGEGDGEDGGKRAGQKARERGVGGEDEWQKIVEVVVVVVKLEGREGQAGGGGRGTAYKENRKVAGKIRAGHGEQEKNNEPVGKDWKNGRNTQRKIIQV